MPVNFYKVNWVISRFPDTSRKGNVLSIQEYAYYTAKILNFQNTSFFDQISQLFVENNKMVVQQWFENENSAFAECYGAKNAYLSFWVGQNAENVLYTLMSHTNIRNVINSFVVVWNCDNIYSSRCVTNSYNVFYASNIHNCSDVFFSTNLLSCTECILCNELENQSYCIRNKQYTKEEFLMLKSKILWDKNIYDTYYQQILSADINNKLSENIVGKGIVRSYNITNGYFVQWVHNGRNIFQGWWEYGGQEFYDCFDAGNQKDDHLYATNYVWESSSHVYCVVWWANCNNCYYGYHLENCSFCLGCIWLKNKSYCILNKQYTKEERYEKVDEIFAQMEADGTLGQFFPATMNPFYFNDTAAYLIDPSFTKEEVIARGYLWRDEPIKVDIPEGMKIMKVNELSNYEWRIDDPQSAHQTWFIDPEILKVIIQDEQWNVYRIVKMEYDFLVKHGLPLPRKHRLDRMKENFRIH